MIRTSQGLNKRDKDEVNRHLAAMVRRKLDMCLSRTMIQITCAAQRFTADMP